MEASNNIRRGDSCVHISQRDDDLVASNELISSNGVGESATNANSAVASQLGSASNMVVDWNTLEIIPIQEDQIGSVVPVVGEDNLYAYIGLRDEDERAEKEKERLAAEGVEEGTAVPTHDFGNMDVEGASIPVNDRIPGEDGIFYDKEDPPMVVGSKYASMKEFRSAVRQHAIKGQFEMGIQKSEPDRFRGYCKAENCPWAIVARLMNDKKSVMVTMNESEHLCASTGRVKTTMTTYHWIAEKAIPFLNKDPNIGAKKLQDELQDKYNVQLGYSTVWAGRQKALEKLFGSWEESFVDLYRFKAEVELKMPGSIVEIDVQVEDDGVYFRRFFCCFKPSIDGFLNGCRPYLSVDSTALNGRWNGHLASATGIDGHNWMYPFAFGFFPSETLLHWTWFMEQLYKAVGHLPYLAISSDASKGIAGAVKKVFPWAEHRECFWHLMQNFIKHYRGPVFGNMYPAARTFLPDRYEYHMDKIYEADSGVSGYLELHHKALWSRSKFSEEIKCDFITNNLAESWNKWVKDIKDLPVCELADTLRTKFMVLYAKRRKIGERLTGAMLPAVVQQLNAMTRCLGNLKVSEGNRDTAQVTEITTDHDILRHAVHIGKHTCSCREWQVSGKPCLHALTLIISTRNPKMEDYLHPYYSVYNFRIAYAGVIQPLPDKSQWPKVNLGFVLFPPLVKRSVGRQWKNRIKGCLEKGGSSRKDVKGKWQVLCNKCGERGHRETSSKCYFNGSKKRKSRAKQGRPLGSGHGEGSNNITPERQQIVTNELHNTSPGPVTRRQLALAIRDGQGATQEIATPPRATKSPSKVAAKKITPRKKRN